MIFFTVDPRTNYQSEGCNTCCCEQFKVRPGETNKVMIDYAPWSVPIVGKGLSCGTKIEISECKNCGDDTGLLAANSFVRALFETPFDGKLSPLITNPDSLNLKYSILSFYRPERGQIELNAETGEYTYTPNQNFKGFDRFFYAVEAIEDNGVTAIGEVIIAVEQEGDAPLNQPPFTPDIDAPESRIRIDRINQTVNFPLVVSPAAKIGNIYRMTIHQPALDCDCNPFYHESCYDIQVAKC